MTLNQRVVGSIHVDAWHFLSFSKTLNPHCCSPPRCINGYPVGLRTIIVNEFASANQAARQGILPREWKLHYECGLKMCPVTGVMIYMIYKALRNICIKRYINVIYYYYYYFRDATFPDFSGNPDF